MADRAGPAQVKQVKIYTTPACPWCGVAKRYFADHGVNFTDVDVSADRRGLREMVTTTGQYGVPVILVGEKAMVGWNAQEFHRLFGQTYRKRG